MKSVAVRRSFTLSLAAILGLAPFAGDMYLSSLPAIGAEFSAPVWVTQLTLTGYLLLLGAGQLVAGPVTDALGRRRPLLVGLGVFTLGSLLAALAPSMGVLVAARVLQGLGGAIAVVVANSSVRDRTKGEEATRLYALLMSVSALAPVIAPAAGGVIDQRFGWRAVFVALALMGALVMLGAARFLPESLPARDRSALALGPALSGYGRLFRSREVVLPLATLAAMLMVLFAYIGGASYVYQGVFGLDPATFGLLFGGTGLALMLGAVLANRLASLMGSARLAVLGVLTAVLGTGLAAVAMLSGGPMWLIVAGMGLNLFGLGACEPALMSRFMSAVTDGAGQAAALMGASQFILGAAATAIGGTIAASTALGWTVLMVALAVIALALALIGSRPPARVPALRTPARPVPVRSMVGG